MTTTTMPRETAFALIARAAHEANRAYCQITEDPLQRDRWERMTDEFRAGLTRGVVKIANLAIAGETVLPSTIHEAWMADKKADGWTLGAFDPEKKTHPNLKPFGELPEAQQKKDELFIVVVWTLLDLTLGIEMPGARAPFTINGATDRPISPMFGQGQLAEAAAVAGAPHPGPGLSPMWDESEKPILAAPAAEDTDEAQRAERDRVMATQEEGARDARDLDEE